MLSVVVPAVPHLVSVDRISGLTARVHWIPLTPNEAKGVVTQLQIVYEPTKSDQCSQFDFDVENYHVKHILFVQSMMTITNLHPDTEYCIAIEVSTVGRHSGYSTPLKIACRLLQ